MRQVHEQVCNRRDEMQMADDVDDNVCRIEETEKPEVEA